MHAYYATYMALQGWFEANQIGGVADDHTATLRTISGQIRERKLFPPPWSVLAVGNAPRKERSYLNVPAGADLAGDLEVLANPRFEEFWPRYGTWLRSTRKARLLAKEAEWKKKNNRNEESAVEVFEHYGRVSFGIVGGELLDQLSCQTRSRRDRW